MLDQIDQRVLMEMQERLDCEGRPSVEKLRSIATELRMIKFKALGVTADFDAVLASLREAESRSSDWQTLRQQILDGIYGLAMRASSGG